MTRPAWLAEPHEAETVARLLVEFRDWHGRDWPSNNAFLASVERLIELPDTEYLLASADDDAPPCGVAQLRFRHSVWTASDDAWLEDLYVRDPARGHGVGEALVALAVHRSQQRGCRRLELDVNEHNQAARRLYERLGFEGSQKPPGGATC